MGLNFRADPLTTRASDVKTCSLDGDQLNSVQLAEKLKRKRGVSLSPDHLRGCAQKKGGIWKRTRQSHRERQDAKQRAFKQGDLEMLELAAAAGEIDLLYGDESGCCLWIDASYS